MKWACGAFGGLLLVALASAQPGPVKQPQVAVPPPLPPGGPFQPQPQPQPPNGAPRRVPGVVTLSGPPRYDIHGDQLPPGAFARYGTVRLRHGSEPVALAFSPDGKVLGSLSPTQDGIRLWDPKTGKEVARLNSPVTLAAFARDGSMLVIDESRCRHWVPAGNVVRDLPEKTLPEGVSAQGLAVHPNLRSFAVGVPGKVLFLDLQTGKQLQELKCPGEQGPTRLVFSPDGRWLAGTAADQGIWLWDLRTHKRVRTYRTEHNYPEFSFSPDGSRLAVAGDKLLVHATDSEEPPEGYTAPEGELHCPRFSADGKWVFAISPTGAVARVDAATGEAKDPTEPPEENLRPPTVISGEGTFAAAVDESGGIRIWDTKTGKGPEAPRLPMLFNPGFSADGKSFSVLTADGPLHVCDAATGKLLKTVELPVDPDTITHWDPVARRVTSVISGEDSVVEVIDPDTRKRVGKVSVPATAGFPVAAFCPTDRDRVALFLQGSVVVFNVPTGKAVRTLNFGLPENSPPARGAVSPDGRLVAVATGAFSVWEVTTGKKRFELKAIPGAAGAAFSPDGRLVAGWDREGNVVVFDVRFGTASRRFQAGEGADDNFAVAFSPDSTRLVTGGNDGLITLWDIAMGDSVVSFTGHDGAVTGLGWSPDGTRLASSSTDGTVLLWEVPPKSSGKPGEAPVAGFDDAFRLLGSPDPAAGQRGMDVLYRHPVDAPKQCAERIPVPVAAAPTRIAKLIKDLDDEDFPVRAAAVKELDAVGGEAVPQLRAVVEKSESAEVRKLAADLLVRIEVSPPKPDEMRAVRAVEVLETLGTPEARAVLAKWATGPAGHRLTVEATAAVARLKLKAKGN